MNVSIPSDISIDLDHQPEPSNASDYDEEKERQKIAMEQDSTDGRDGSTGRKEPVKGGNGALNFDMLQKFEDEFSATQKVFQFLQDNPMRVTFMKKHKSRLPYSVFRAHGT